MVIKKKIKSREEAEFIHPLNKIMVNFECSEVIETKTELSLEFKNKIINWFNFKAIKNIHFPNLFKNLWKEYVKIWNLYINKIEVNENEK
jgi:hypothetical protein